MEAQKRVVIIGGGVAGMSAAHELAERGYAVEVFERNPQYVGGKARSVDVPGTNIRDPDRYLPGEHGFRFFAERMWQLMTSCRERRYTDYERLSWWDYLDADRFSKTYQTLLVAGLTRT